MDRAREMTYKVKGLDTMPDELSSTPRAHNVEGEKQAPQVVL